MAILNEEKIAFKSRMDYQMSVVRDSVMGNICFPVNACILDSVRNSFVSDRLSDMLFRPNITAWKHQLKTAVRHIKNEQGKIHG